LHHDIEPYHTSFFTWECLTQNDITLVLQPTLLSLSAQLKIKLKGRHFDANEVIEAESQAMLNTLTEHDFQDAFEIGRISRNGA
jgi:hypothetical protein